MKHRTDELYRLAVEVTLAHKLSDAPNKTGVERPPALKSDEPNILAVEVTFVPESSIERPQSASHYGMGSMNQQILSCLTFIVTFIEVPCSTFE